MSISIRAVLRSDRTNKENKAPVHIRFTQNRKSKYTSTDVTIDINDWDSVNQRIISNSEESRTLQLQIDNRIEEYHKKMRRLEALEVEITLDILVNTNSRKAPNPTIESYFDKLIDGFEKSGKVNSATKYYFCLFSLKKFRPMNITFDKIDKALLSDFEQYLRDRGAVE